MGIFSAIGSFLGLVNKNPTASELASDISSGVDMLVYTKEEQAIDKAKMTVQATEAWLRMLEAMKSSEAYRSVTRRVLALGIVFNLLAMIWLCIVMELLSAFKFIDVNLVKVGELEFTQATWAILKIAGIFQLGWVFCTIIVFYFGPHLIQFFMKGKS